MHQSSAFIQGILKTAASLLPTEELGRFININKLKNFRETSKGALALNKYLSKTDDSLNKINDELYSLLDQHNRIAESGSTTPKKLVSIFDRQNNLQDIGVTRQRVDEAVRKVLQEGGHSKDIMNRAAEILKEGDPDRKMRALKRVVLPATAVAGGGYAVNNIYNNQQSSSTPQLTDNPSVHSVSSSSFSPVKALAYGAGGAGLGGALGNWLTKDEENKKRNTLIGSMLGGGSGLGLGYLMNKTSSYNLGMTKAAAEHHDFLRSVQDQAKEKGYDIFAVVNNPKAKDGCSVYSNASGKDKTNAIYHARQSHMKWEGKNGIDPHHDWRKESK